MKIEIHKCDILNCSTNEQKVVNINLQVIFETDQTEGRSCTPYLTIVNIDLCKCCYNKILSGNYVHAHGAQGYNTYYFEKKNN